jgi:hypothetical protein
MKIPINTKECRTEETANLKNIFSFLISLKENWLMLKKVL